jgi:ech hydrogenase subunit B
MSNIVIFLLIVLAPIYAAFFEGAQRVLKAKMQRRIGPPLMQPFYDMYKLMDKRALMVNKTHTLFALFYFFTLWILIAFIFLGFNLLYIIFLHLLASIILILAGFSVKSIFSHIGSNRKLLAIVAYEPILLLISVGIYMVYGTFEISVILNTPSQFLSLIFVYFAIILIIPAITKLSPFDAPKAHQEIVGGIEIEYGSIFYEFLYAAKFLEMIFAYSFIYILAGSNHLFGGFLVVFSFLLVNLIDNSTARIQISHMVKVILICGITLCSINILGSLLWA